MRGRPRLKHFDVSVAEELLLYRIAEVDFRPMVVQGGIKPLLFKIYIESSRRDDEDRKMSLIHELLHAFCFINGIHASEKMIEEAAQRFVVKNSGFVDAIFKKLRNGNQEFEIWANPLLRVPKLKE